MISEYPMKMAICWAWLGKQIKKNINIQLMQYSVVIIQSLVLQNLIVIWFYPLIYSKSNICFQNRALVISIFVIHCFRASWFLPLQVYFLYNGLSSSDITICLIFILYNFFLKSIVSDSAFIMIINYEIEFEFLIHTFFTTNSKVFPAIQ